MAHEVIVLKFGSSVLGTAADLPNAAHEIYRWYRAGFGVVAVVSAIADTTDRLIGEARELAETPEPYALAELLATGERASAALLGVALDRAGVPARVLNPREIGLLVAGSALDGEPVSANAGRLQQLISETAVLVVPGFFGTDVEGRTHCLGRGGSDLTAVFLAQVLGARCRLIKDVDGVYERDPALAEGSRPRRFECLTYADAFRVAAPLIQPKAVSFLEPHGSRAEVASLAAPYESVVCAGPTAHAAPLAALPATPSKVLLLGLGTVGFGVYQRSPWNPEHIRVVGTLVRDRARHADQVPGELLHTSLESVCGLGPDIVVDALPGIGPSQQLVEYFLKRGVHVVSANKALIAEAGPALTALARRSGATLRYSASVGGAAPMIEAIDRAAAQGSVVSIAGVFSGSCNFILDRCAEGLSLESAIAEAQAQGFAEASPLEDLSGRDAARKLRILARRAFGIDFSETPAEFLGEDIARRAREAASDGKRLRQIARAVGRDTRVHAAVQFEAVEQASTFGRLAREWNALEIVSADGSAQIVTGRGAGRWPTTEAVMADLLEVHRERSRGVSRSRRPLAVITAMAISS